MRPDAVTQAQFLAAIFHGVAPDKHIELRGLPDSKAGPPIFREWIPVGSDPTAPVAHFTQVGAKANAAVCYGVLPRREYGVGKSEDTTASSVVWADIDDKDHGNDAAKARSYLDTFPIAPNIVVCSGHGLHAYWLLSELCEPERLSALSKAVGMAVGGDNVSDRARLLRMPGTTNLKNPDAPLPVVIEVFEPERRVTAVELEQAAALSGYCGPDETDAPDAASEGFADKPIDMTGMPPQVEALLKSNKRVRDLFIGVGKPAHGRNGEPLDQTASGYDYSFLFELAKRNILDPELLASAVVCRPDGHARSKGVRYVRRTVSRVLDVLKPKQANVLFELGIDRVEMFMSDPALFQFHIGDRHFRLDAAALLAPMRFCEAYLQVAARTPAIPHKKAEWLPWVDALLAVAERVPMPPDASDEAILRERIAATIENLPLTSDLAELGSKAFQLDDGRRAFKPEAVRKLLLEDFKDLTRAATCRVLRTLAYASGTHRVGDKPTRLWASKEGS